MTVKNCKPYYNMYPREKCVSDVMEVMKRSTRKGVMILVGGGKIELVQLRGEEQRTNIKTMQ